MKERALPMYTGCLQEKGPKINIQDYKYSETFNKNTNC